jgi:Yip1 domain
MEPTNQPLTGTTKTNLIDRAKNIIVQPAREWDVISMETPNSNQIITGYVLPLAGAAALAAFIGYAFVGINMLGVRVAGIDWGIYQALTILIGAIVSVYLTAVIIDALAPSFQSEKNFNRSLQLVAYSFTPAWLGGLLALIPSLAFIGSLFGLYSLYLLYIGLPKLKKTPADKQTGYFVVSLVVCIVVYMAVAWILGSILMRTFGLTYGTYGL